MPNIQICSSDVFHAFFPELVVICMLFTFLAVALCPNPADIANGMVTFTNTSIGDTATYTCSSGFELIGSATTTCTQVDVNTAVFPPPPPMCRREYYRNMHCTSKYKAMFFFFR